MRNMKGFVFTVDAIFSLVIASAATSILLLALYYPSVQLQGTSSESLSVAQSLTQTTVGQAARGSPYAYDFVSGYLSKKLAWPQYGQNASQSSSTSGAGPQIPLILFNYTVSNQIFPTVVASDGYVVFETANNLYELNGTSGTVVFNSQSYAPYTGTAAIYRGTVFVMNSLNYINALTESGKFVWSKQITTTQNAFLQIEDGLLEINTTILNPLNGTAAVKSTEGVSMTYSNGEFFSVTPNSPTTANVIGYAITGNILQPLYSRHTIAITSGSYAPPLAVGDGSLYFALKPGASGSSFYSYNLGGTQNWAITLPASIQGGAAVYNTSVFAKTSNYVYGFSNTGANVFATPIAADSYSTTLSATPTLVYALVNGRNLYAFNEQTGITVWNVTLNSTAPTSASIPGDIAIAYGNAYVAVGNTLYAVGTCKADPGASLLATIASMYINKQGGCANLLLNASYSTSKVAIYINNTYGPSYWSGSFSGNNMLSAPGVSAGVVGTAMTLSLWVNPNANSPTDMMYAGIRGPLGKNVFYLQQRGGSIHTAAGVLINSGGSTFTVTGTIQPYVWNHLVLVYNGSNLAMYVNGVESNAGTANGYIQNSNLAFDIGGDLLPLTRFLIGNVSDVQLYSSALTQAQIQTLYNGGVGAEPVSSNIVGWWPLEGDTNDYSGYNYAIPQNAITYVHVPETPPGISSSAQVSRYNLPFVLNSNGVYLNYSVGVLVWR